MRRAHRDFRYHPEACESFIIHNSSFYLFWFVSDPVTSLRELARRPKGCKGCPCPAQPRSAISRRVSATYRSRSDNPLSPYHPYPLRLRFPLHTRSRRSRRRISPLPRPVGNRARATWYLWRSLWPCRSDVRSAMFVPLAARGRVLGVMVLTR